MGIARAGLVLLVALPFAAGAAPPALTPLPFVSGLASPVEIAHAGDHSGRLFVLERAGRVRVVKDGQLLPAPFLDLSAANGGPVIAGGERGLLGLAFHPAYTDNGRFFVFYTRALPGDPDGHDLVVSRFSRSAGDPDLAEPTSESIVLVVPHPTYANHNGGKLAFGRDGYLYVAIGDGGGGGDPFNAGQNLADLRGKILRLDVDGAAPYAIPPSNPFAGTGARAEIWAYGLRNPWRFSFDRDSGDLFIGDVGQNAWEEIDHEPFGSPGGNNYGWRVFEGSHCHNPPSGCSLAGHVPPIIEFAHGPDGASVTGGSRYRGRALAGLQGYYVYGDFVTGSVWAAEPQAGTWVSAEVATVPGLSSFGEDESGELYAANLFSGTIVRLTPAATTIARLSNLSTRGPVSTGNDVMIGGFILGGTSPKTVVVRARGPSLASAGVAGPLANPALQLVRSSDQATLAVNDDWQTAGNAEAIAASGFAPSDALEPAILTILAPGGYTAIVSGAGGGTGVGIVEVFEVSRPDVPLLNVSTRGQVLTGEQVVIGGFVVQGDAPTTVVVRARGPSLAAFGVANPLANPTLTLVRSSDQATIGANDDWQSASNAAAISASGFAPADPLESAILATLAPGAYTAVMSGVAGGTGVGIVEVFAQ